LPLLWSEIKASFSPQFKGTFTLQFMTQYYYLLIGRFLADFWYRSARFTSGKIIHLIGTTHTTAQSSALTHPAGRPVWVKSSSFGLQMQKRSSRF